MAARNRGSSPETSANTQKVLMWLLQEEAGAEALAWAGGMEVPGWGQGAGSGAAVPVPLGTDEAGCWPWPLLGLEG